MNSPYPNRIPTPSKPSPSIIRLKLLALSVPLSGVAWSRYQNLLLLDAGYSVTSIGLFKTFGFIAKIIFAPVWGFVGDLTSPVLTLALSYIISGLSLELVRQCLLQNWSFTVLLVIKTIRSATNCISPVTEAVLYSATRNRTDNETYGKQRMLSSIAWGSGALFVGFMIDKYGLYSVFNYTYFMCSLTLFLLYMLSKYDYGIIHGNQWEEKSDVEELRAIPVDNDDDKKKWTTQTTKTNKNTTTSASEVVKGLKELFLHPELKRTACQIIVTGFVMTLVDVLLPLQLEQEFQTSRLFNGLTTWISILSSIPIYWCSQQLIDRKGAFWMFRVAQSTYGVRLIGMVVLSLGNLETTVQYVFLSLLQLLHGVTFALVWIAATHKLQSFSSSKRKVTTSASTLVSTLYFTVGQGCGNIFWMYLYQKYSNCALLYGIGWCILVLNRVALYFVNKVEI
tara:strand:+ start:219 stop:1574 length:1356 start_codon:yes stop_codon:yes gene_type:complete